MSPPILACMMRINTDLPAMAAVFLVVKPLAYYFFIQAYRYRVSRDIPMTHMQIAKLAALRAVLGVVLVGAIAFALRMGTLQNTALSQRADRYYLLLWGYTYATRLVSWWIVGRYGASLGGRRLIGWIVTGMLLNLGLDIAALAGLFAGFGGTLVSAGVLAVFISILYAVGHRKSLKAKFQGGIFWEDDQPLCAGCRYNLTGNLSGVCPECGKGIALSTASPSL